MRYYIGRNEEVISNQQLVIDIFEEKIRMFTHEVNGKLIKEEDFVLANAEIPTDTFNVLLPKFSHIKKCV